MGNGTIQLERRLGCEAKNIISVLERYYKIKIIPERHRGNVGVLSLLYCRWYAGSSEGGYYRK